MPLILLQSIYLAVVSIFSGLTAQSAPSESLRPQTNLLEEDNSKAESDNVVTKDVKPATDLELNQLLRKILDFPTNAVSESQPNTPKVTKTGDAKAATKTGDAKAATKTGDAKAANKTGDAKAANKTGDTISDQGIDSGVVVHGNPVLSAIYVQVSSPNVSFFLKLNAVVILLVLYVIISLFILRKLSLLLSVFIRYLNLSSLPAKYPWLKKICSNLSSVSAKYPWLKKVYPSERFLRILSTNLFQTRGDRPKPTGITEISAKDNNIVRDDIIYADRLSNYVIENLSSVVSEIVIKTVADQYKQGKAYIDLGLSNVQEKLNDKLNELFAEIDNIKQNAEENTRQLNSIKAAQMTLTKEVQDLRFSRATNDTQYQDKLDDVYAKIEGCNQILVDKIETFNGYNIKSIKLLNENFTQLNAKVGKISGLIEKTPELNKPENAPKGNKYENDDTSDKNKLPKSISKNVVLDEVSETDLDEGVIKFIKYFNESSSLFKTNCLNYAKSITEDQQSFVDRYQGQLGQNICFFEHPSGIFLAVQSPSTDLNTNTYWLFPKPDQSPNEYTGEVWEICFGYDNSKQSLKKEKKLIYPAKLICGENRNRFEMIASGKINFT